MCESRSWSLFSSLVEFVCELLYSLFFVFEFGFIFEGLGKQEGETILYGVRSHRVPWTTGFYSIGYYHHRRPLEFGLRNSGLGLDLVTLFFLFELLNPIH